MSQLQATLDTILDKVAILESRFDKLLTQSLVQLSDSAHAHEGEINVELSRRAETVAQAVLSLDRKIGSLEQIYPIYSPLQHGTGVGVQAGSQQGFSQVQMQQGQVQMQQNQVQMQQNQVQMQQGFNQQMQQGQQVQMQQGQQVQMQGQVQMQQMGQQFQQVGEEMITAQAGSCQNAAPSQGGDFGPSGFPKLEKTKEKLLKEIKRVITGPSGERKVITYSPEEAQKLKDAGEELLGEELTEEEAEAFYQEMLAEAEAEMGALEMSIEDYSEMADMEHPPENLISFANETAEFLENLMLRLTGIAGEVTKLPSFVVNDEEYLQIMNARVDAERHNREEQRLKDKKARRVGFGTNVEVREFQGEENDNDDVGSEYGSEFSEGSEASDGSSMFSESIASEVPEGWVWDEKIGDYVYVGDQAMETIEGEEGGQKGKYVYVEGEGGSQGQYYFVPDGTVEEEINVQQDMKVTAGKVPAGAKAMSADQMEGKISGKAVSFLSMQEKKQQKMSLDIQDFAGGEGSGKKLQLKKKKKKDEDDEEGPKIEAPTGPDSGSDAWAAEMAKKKAKAKRKKSRENKDKAGGEGGASYDQFKPKLLDKVPWEQPPPGVRPPAPVKKHDVPLPKDSKVLGVKPAIEWILKQPGPFCTTRMVYRNSGKTTRPLYVEKAFEDLHNFSLQGLVVGMLFTVKGNNLANTKCFMKCAPAFCSKRYLREFGISIEEYRENYLRVDNHASKDPFWFDLVDRVKEVHPWIDDFPVDIAYGNVAGMTREEMMLALKERHKEFLEKYEAERAAIRAQFAAKSDVRVDETGKIVVRRKFKATASGLPHMPKDSWEKED